MKKVIKTLIPAFIGLFIWSCSGSEKTQATDSNRAMDTTEAVMEEEEMDMEEADTMMVDGDSTELDSMSFEYGVWKVVAIGDVEIPEQGNNSTLKFQQGKVSGKGLCNVVQGDYVQTEDSLIFMEPMITTKMACPGEFGTMDDQFQEALLKVQYYKMEDGKLHLFYEEDKAIILERY